MPRRRPIVNAFCCYCKRVLSRSDSGLNTAATRDHVIAESDGGKRWVPCCVRCNDIKGDLPPDDWWWFVRSCDRYWRTYTTKEQVARAIRREHVRRAYVNAGREPPSWPA